MLVDVVVISSINEFPLVKKFGYDTYPVVITGEGGYNAINALKHLDRGTKILNIGYCGSNHFKRGQVVKIDLVHTCHDRASFSDGCFLVLDVKCNAECKSVTCYTSSDFVTSTTIEEPCVFDMELAYICAYFDNVASLKVVSDNLNKEEFDQWVSESISH